MSLSKPQRMHKPRFKDWLIEVLDRNVCEDAQWVDRANGIAKIRWPHKSRGTWTLDKDAKLFRMWAIISGKYRLQCDEPNPKSWKCNFRMNLNICKDIVEMKNRRVAKGPQACRFFQFLDKGQSFPNYVHGNQAFTECGTILHHLPDNGVQTVPSIYNDCYRPFDGAGIDLHYGISNQLPDTDQCTVPGSYTPVTISNPPIGNHFESPHSNLSLPIEHYRTDELSHMADTFDPLQCAI